MTPRELTIYRVQDSSGRGPWRPGFSHVWIDYEAPVGRLTETLMDLMPVAQLRALPPDRFYGCGCRSFGALMEWFTPLERRRLDGMGFRVVRLRADKVLAESSWQLLFERSRPFTDGATILRWNEKVVSR